MKTKNFANFGLFSDGILLSFGSMTEMINNASLYVEKHANSTCTISTINTDKPSIEEGVKILRYSNVDSVIYIINEL